MKERLQELMNQVFDENGCIKLCGRQTCIKLIELSTEFDKATHAKDADYAPINFGNTHTGYMNVENLLKLRSEIS